MAFDEIIADYYQELSMLYKDRIESDSTLFDNDRYIHGLTCHVAPGVSMTLPDTVGNRGYQHGNNNPGT
jgi:hypothetical protein